MKTLVLLAVALLLALPLSAQTDKVTATGITQTKPNYLGETKTTFKDANGKTVGEGIMQTKPNYLGETKTTSELERHFQTHPPASERLQRLERLD